MVTQEQKSKHLLDIMENWYLQLNADILNRQYTYAEYSGYKERRMLLSEIFVRNHAYLDDTAYMRHMQCLALMTSSVPLVDAVLSAISEGPEYRKVTIYLPANELTGFQCLTDDMRAFTGIHEGDMMLAFDFGNQCIRLKSVNDHAELTIVLGE